MAVSSAVAASLSHRRSRGSCRDEIDSGTLHYLVNGSMPLRICRELRRRADERC
jgi:hypothetical protein